MNRGGTQLGYPSELVSRASFHRKILELRRVDGMSRGASLGARLSPKKLEISSSSRELFYSLLLFVPEITLPDRLTRFRWTKVSLNLDGVLVVLSTRAKTSPVASLLEKLLSLPTRTGGGESVYTRQKILPDLPIRQHVAAGTCKFQQENRGTSNGVNSARFTRVSMEFHSVCSVFAHIFLWLVKQTIQLSPFV